MYTILDRMDTAANGGTIVELGRMGKRGKYLAARWIGVEMPDGRVVEIRRWF